MPFRNKPSSERKQAAQSSDARDAQQRRANARRFTIGNGEMWELSQVHSEEEDEVFELPGSAATQNQGEVCRKENPPRMRVP